MSQVDSSAGASDILVSFRGVQKSYDGENLIVKDLNLDIRKGEFLTLLCLLYTSPSPRDRG